MKRMRGHLFIVCISILLFSFTACDSNLTSETESADSDFSIEQLSATHTSEKANVEQALDEVRSSTAKYQDLKKAKSDGFRQFSIHVPGMGIHYLHKSNFNNNAESTLDRMLERKDPEILVYVDEATESPQQRLVAAEYAIPKLEGESTPPSNALGLFPGLTANDWHVHPSAHDLPQLDHAWTIHGECHYRGGLGVFLAENPDGEYKLYTPPTGALGSWNGTVEPGQCPTSLGGNPLPNLLVAHGKWWTLHAWIWQPNPEGIFHPTNPHIGSGS